MTTNYTAAYQRIREQLRAGTLTRRRWSLATDDGREILRLWFALVGGDTPDGDYFRRTSVGLPEWCARLLLWMDYYGSIEKWPETVCKTVRVLERASRTLDAEAWQRLNYTIRTLALREVMLNYDHPAALAVCSEAITLCERAARGDDPSETEWGTVKNTAESVAVGFLLGLPPVVAATVPASASATADTFETMSAQVASVAPQETWEFNMEAVGDYLITVILHTIDTESDRADGIVTNP